MKSDATPVPKRTTEQGTGQPEHKSDFATLQRVLTRDLYNEFLETELAIAAALGEEMEIWYRASTNEMRRKYDWRMNRIHELLAQHLRDTRPELLKLVGEWREGR